MFLLIFIIAVMLIVILLLTKGMVYCLFILFSNRKNKKAKRYGWKLTRNVREIGKIVTSKCIIQQILMLHYDDLGIKIELLVVWPFLAKKYTDLGKFVMFYFAAILLLCVL